jgi:hypothetical protein
MMNNSKIVWISVMTSIALVALLSAENVRASGCSSSSLLADVDEEEAAIAENAMMATGANETGTENMTGANSTS